MNNSLVVEKIIFRDSLSSQNKEIFLEKNKIVNLYLCGPTVYSDVHIGNLRSVIFFDLITRVLSEKKIGYRYVQNITDVDDKIIKQSAIKKVEEFVLAENYTKNYKQILRRLNIKKPEFYLVTENIQEIVNFIKRLIVNKSAYLENGNVLFSVSQEFKKKQCQYGRLSKQLISKLLREKGREISNQQKQNEKDFILWKKTEKGVSWKTEWSVGRPGWHSECAAIINKVFRGETIDIHGGGKDLLFPHHENERIQYIAANNRELSKIWIHFGLVLSKNRKMSKSEGNYLTAKKFIEKYNGNTLRMLILDSCYNEDFTVNEKVITQSVNRVKKIENVMKKISLFIYFNNLQREKISCSKKEEILKLLLNNLSTTKVISILTGELSFINKQIDNPTKQKELEVVINNFLFGLEIMGFFFPIKKYNSEIKKTLQEWKKLLAQGMYGEADLLRKNLQKEGII